MVNKTPDADVTLRRDALFEEEDSETAGDKEL